MDELTSKAGEWIANNVPFFVLIVCFVISIFFEVSKVKVYPLRWIWKLISYPLRKVDEQRTTSFKAITASLKEDIDTRLTEMNTMSTENCNSVKRYLNVLEGKFSNLEKRFDTLDSMQTQTEERLDKLAAARIKNHVLNFARQCRKDELHSREDFVNLFKENEEYEKLVKKYGWENNVYKHDYAYIEHIYDECNLKGTFLGE